ncbi:uncharacterized protein B0I36DRAFT_330524 [Microdochium trichocladiopsis]|uniref:SMP-30/Gluconolactonase/LRE-like region domain-containing protein n=1 Tax=Microdochium trichocladiopsis TaxID=1682393 RepID=A0A9P8Y0A4_9PEZI|nr:uncharacterized protein B0I36DRAFT_330524 [Microdochium trichocladiopsis]KAH7026373.1 hypothetical protein B0I36DRAFT_330524 [Microdochium trichocladiopsis]
MAKPRGKQVPQAAPKSSQQDTSLDKGRLSSNTMLFGFLAIAVLGAAVYVNASPKLGVAFAGTRACDELPAQAQRINQKAFNVLPAVLPLTESNATTFFHPPGTDTESLKARPFHVYDDEFLNVIGSNPKLSLIAHEASGNPIFHEAVVWYPPTEEVFFVQNAGAPAAGTGLNKSSLIYKISLAQAEAVIDKVNASGLVDVVEAPSNPTVVNPNGGTNYKGQILFAAEGQGANIPSELVIMNPVEPYNTTVLLNNYFGRQFSSLNDLAVNPKNNDVYFTDTLYGYLQNFRPPPGLRNQVYRYNDVTGAVTVVADGFVLPNGVTFSPDGTKAYVADTGANQGFWGWNQSEPSTIYSYDVLADGTWDNRKTFSYIDSGVPDGVHCDTNGNVYAGCGDGIHVWNPSGKLLGKIYLGETSANFNFAGNGRMVICAETNLYFAEFAAVGGTYIY